MPRGASSLASVFAIAPTDDRTTFDSARLAIGSLTADDVDTRIAPPPRDSIDDTASRTSRTALSTSSSNAPRHASSSNDSAAPGGGPPVFTMSRSTPWKRSSVRACQSAMASADRRSTGTASGSVAVSRPIRRPASAIAEASRDPIDTSAPSAASARATA